jgi:hypothetical protein
VLLKLDWKFMSQGKRRPWEDADNKTLIGLWDVVRSVYLISIMLDRSRSSVQTQASRLALPARAEESDQHRRRWSNLEDNKLDAIITGLTRPDGRIPIQEVAEKIGRSVDAVAARLETRYGEGSAMMTKLVAPPMPTLASPDKAKGKMKNCLQCRKSFWSEGSHNWICVTCKRSDNWGYEP